MNSPFKFLDAYTAEDKAIFFGREDEIEGLYALVFQTRLLLVYGPSGTGKTSLIQCGLAKRIKPTDWIPLLVRRKDDINAALDAEICRAAPTPIDAGASVVEAVESLYLDHLRPVYLLFDQFEELFIFGSTAEQEKFIASIQALLAKDMACKIVLIMREEYLALLDRFEKSVPSLFNKRLRVEPMNKTNILHVITGTTAALGIELENGDATAQRIIDNISDPRNGVQLAYLQVYLDKLFRSAGGVAPVAFTDALIDATGALGDVMAEFLEEQTRSIQADVHANFPDIDKDAVQRIIEEFATLEGTKAPLTRAELAARLPAFDKIIDGVLTALQNARLFRNVDGRLELAHDSLALRVADQRSADSKAALKIEKIVRDRMSGFEQTGTWLNAEETTLVRSTFATLRLSPAERDFYTGSVEKVAEAAAAEESRRQAELARERALSAANARAAQIAKQRTRWVAGAALIMFILMLLAGYAQIKANRAERQKAQTISAAIKNADGVVQFINLNVAGLANENALREEILRRAILLQLSLFNGRVPGDNLSYAQLLQSYARLMYDTRQTSRAKKMAMPLVIQARANLRQNPDNEDWKIVEASMQFILLDSMQGLRERKAAAIRALENDKTALGYANVAELEIQLGEYESARRNLEMAQTLMPKDYLAELFVGYQWSRLYVALGDLDNARKSLRETRDSADKVTTLADKDFQYYQLATYCLIGEIFLPDTTGEGISSLEKAKNLNTYLIKKYHPSVDIEKSILKCRVKLESM